MATSSKPAPAKSAKPAQTLPHDEYGHGHSVAAWTAVTVVMVGSLIACLGVGFLNWPVAIVGGVIALAGGPIGKILGALGFGSSHKSTR